MEPLVDSTSQLYALIRRRDLIAIKVGGRGQWRVERAQLEDYIARAYTDTAQWITDHPWTGTDDADQAEDEQP